MSNGWEKYEREYNRKFERELVNQELEQAMPFKAFVFWIGVAAGLVGWLLSYVVRHFR